MAPFPSTSTNPTKDKHAVEETLHDGTNQKTDAKSTKLPHIPAHLQNTSFQLHTKSSKAKQTGKVDFGLSKHLHGDLRGSPSALLMPQRSASVWDKELSPQQRGGTNSFPSSAVPTPSRRRSSLAVLTYPGEVEQEPIMVTLPNSAPLGTAHERSPNFNSQGWQEELERLEDDPSDTASEVILEIGSEYEMEDGSFSGGALSNNETNVHPDVATANRTSASEESKAQEVKLIKMGTAPNDAEASVEALQQNADDAETDQDTNEQADINLSEKIEELKKGTDTRQLPSNLATDRNFEALRDWNNVLRKEKAELKQVIQTKNEDLVEATRNVRMSDETCRKLQIELGELTTVVNHMLQTGSNTIPGTKTLKNMKQSMDLGPTTKSLYLALIRFVEQSENKMQSLSSRATQLQRSLADKEQQLSMAKTALEAQKESVTSEAPEEKPVHDVEAGNWERRYKEERRLKEQAERKVEIMKKAAEENYQPDLEKRYRELQIELTEAQDSQKRLQEHVKRYSARARQWEGEYKTIKMKAEKESAGLQDTIEQQGIEMRGYIKAYRDKQMDPGHWHLKDLQEKIEKQERDCEATNEVFNAVKTEKARLEEEIPILMDNITALEEENTKLSNTLVLSGVRSFSPPSPNPDGSTPEQKKNVESRDDRLKKFKAEQDVRRKALELEYAEVEAVMEKVRAQRLGKEFYSKKGWNKFLGQNSWRIWDGDSWATSTGIDRPTEEERGIVKALREKGLIPPWDKLVVEAASKGTGGDHGDEGDEAVDGAGAAC